MTLSEQIEQAVSVKLLRLESRLAATRDESLKPIVGRFSVIDEFTPQKTTTSNESTSKAKRSDRTQRSTSFRAGASAKQELRLQLAPDWQPGDLFALVQREVSGRDGDVPLPVSRSAWRYLTTMPLSSEATPDRLRFFVRYLEHPDLMIANDAYGEFANAPYEDIVAMRDSLPRVKLRQWVIDSRVDRRVIETRLGLYGMLLGLCGAPSDARLLKRVIVDDWRPDTDFRLGIDGMIGGYLLLTGDAGLDVIERTKLANPDVSFTETYAAMQALRFAWTYGDGVVNRDRLRKAMRLLLNQPDLTDLVIADLARWKDWELQPRLMQMYDEDAYQVPAVKRAIVRFMLVSSQPEESKRSTKTGSNSQRPENASPSPDSPPAMPRHVEQAREYLAVIRARDPKIVADCERYFLLK
ncbi:MAG: hypothetical protein ACYTGL_30940 [Planctomycetota bacterium]